MALGGTSCPVKYGFNGAIPELIISRLLSLWGTKEKLLSLIMTVSLQRLKKCEEKF